MSLFNNPNQVKKFIYIFLAIFVTSVILATTKCRAAELDLGGGSTYLRGPTEYAEATVIWPRQIGNIDIYAGALLIGTYDYRGITYGNQIVVRAGFTPRVGPFSASLGIAAIQHEDAFNSGKINFNLGLAWDITHNVTLHIGHVSNAGTHMPNIGRDLVGFTWRFR